MERNRKETAGNLQKLADSIANIYGVSYAFVWPGCTRGHARLNMDEKQTDPRTCPGAERSLIRRYLCRCEQTQGRSLFEMAESRQGANGKAERTDAQHARMNTSPNRSEIRLTKNKFPQWTTGSKDDQFPGKQTAKKNKKKTRRGQKKGRHCWRQELLKSIHVCSCRYPKN